MFVYSAQIMSSNVCFDVYSKWCPILLKFYFMVTYDKGCRTGLCHPRDGDWTSHGDLRVWTQHQEYLKKGTKGQTYVVWKMSNICNILRVIQCQGKLSLGFFLLISKSHKLGFEQQRQNIFRAVQQINMICREDCRGWDPLVWTPAKSDWLLWMPVEKK